MSPSKINGSRPSYKIASIPADGIGLEVISAGITVLQKLSTTLNTFDLDFTHFDWNSEVYKKTGKYIPDGGLETLKKFDAILFGAVGAPAHILQTTPDVPDHISLWSLRLAIVQPLQLYANVRPTRILRGTSSPLSSCLRSPTSLNWVIIRENTEGEYSGHGGRSHVGQPWETATEVSLFTRHGVERIMRFAFETAAARPKRHLTVVTKSNAQRHGMVLWDEIAAEVGREWPGVSVEKVLVDAMTVRMVLEPERIDTVVATNLHADILSDLATALAGSIGIGATANLDPERRAPSMFEPIHGSAFDITGKGIANPVGTFWTCWEMLKWLGESEAAELLQECTETVSGNGIMTKDLGGSASTLEVTEAVCAEIGRRHGGKEEPSAT